MSFKFTEISAIRFGDKPLVDFTEEEIKAMSNPNDIIRVLEDGDKFPIGALVDRCLQLGMNMTICNRAKKNMCHFAAEQGDCEALKKLLDIYPGFVNDIDYLYLPVGNVGMIAKDTPLQYACLKGHLEAAKLLIRYGANVNVPSKTRRPPLAEAVYSGNLELVEYLLQVGANPMAIDPDGRNALFVAAKRGHLEILEKLLSIGVDPYILDGQGFTLLHIALENAKPEIIKKLLDIRLDVNRPCSDAGMRPFDAACCFCDQPILELLIQYGAIWNYPPGVNKHTPLYWAISKKNLKTAKYLLSLGLDPNIPTLNKSNLEMAVASQSIEMVDLLLSHGVNVNTPTFYGVSLLKEPIASGNTAMVSRLLLAGIDPNHKDYSTGKTPLHTAVVEPKSTPEIVDLLISHGSFVNMADKDLNTPLHYACKYSRIPFVEKLLLRGAMPNLMNKEADTPMDLAEFRTVKDILERYGGESSGCWAKFYTNFICCLCNP